MLVFQTMKGTKDICYQHVSTNNSPRRGELTLEPCEYSGRFSSLITETTAHKKGFLSGESSSLFVVARKPLNCPFRRRLRTPQESCCFAPTLLPKINTYIR